MYWYKKAQQYTAFHGTNQDFDVFILDQAGQDKKGATSKEGFWFTDSIEEGQQYADYSAKRNISNQIEHNQKVQNLLSKIDQAEKQGNWSLSEELTSEVESLEFGAMREESKGQKVIKVILNIKNPFIIDASQENYDQQSSIDQAKKEGYDGIIFKNISDSPQGDLTTTQYLVFNSSQIKVVE